MANTCTCFASFMTKTAGRLAGIESRDCCLIGCSEGGSAPGVTHSLPGAPGLVMSDPDTLGENSSFFTLGCFGVCARSGSVGQHLQKLAIHS